MRTVHNLKYSKDIRKELRNNPTPQEVLLWNKVKSNQLGCKFRRQHSMGKYIVYFCCASKKIIIEIDGVQHEDNEKYDIERTKYFNSLGYVVLRFWNNEINVNLEGVLLEIKRTLEVSTTPNPSSSEEGKSTTTF